MDLKRFSSKSPFGTPKLGTDLETWEPGDQAECIVSRQWIDPSGIVYPGPDLGEVRLVAKTDGLEGHPESTYLVFERYGVGRYRSDQFRKVRPQSDEASRAEEEFIASLKPARIPAPVAA